MSATRLAACNADSGYIRRDGRLTRVMANHGVGTIVPDGRMDTTAFINMIDAQLYQAKDNGHNRIVAVDRAGLGCEAFHTHSR
jgi:PleD family two-component response regulator